jgi:hypothetical protein
LSNINPIGLLRTPRQRHDTLSLDDIEVNNHNNSSNNNFSGPNNNKAIVIEVEPVSPGKILIRLSALVIGINALTTIS